MNKLWSVMPLVAFITACGGSGGGDSGSNTPATVSPLAKYIGTWKSACNVREQETVIITEGSNGAIVTNYKEEYFTEIGCTGAVLMTYAYSSNPSATYVDTGDSLVTFPPATTSRSIKIDRVSVAWSAHTASATGSTVTYGAIDATTKGWCVKFNNASSTCIHDDGAYPSVNVAGGLYIEGAKLYSLESTGNNSYLADSGYTKQ